MRRSLGLVARARKRAPALTFDVGDGQALPYDDRTFDAVVFATTLCHVPDPVAALAEARRVLRPEGSLLIYNTATVGLAADDPLPDLRGRRSRALWAWSESRRVAESYRRNQASLGTFRQVSGRLALTNAVVGRGSRSRSAA